MFNNSTGSIAQTVTFDIRTAGSNNYFKQEGWLSPTERASVFAISLRHNLATSGESRRYVVAFTRFAGGGIWLPQESKAHFGLPWVRVPGTIAVNVTWIERGFNACKTHLSMYPSISTVYEL